MSKEQINTICKKLADELSFELVDVEFVKEPIGRVMRVTLDKPCIFASVGADANGGITLEDCEGYHRRLIPLVEHIDYDFLEVSSPGIDRPLKADRDFDKALGKRVEVHLYKPIDKTKKKGNKKLLIGELLSYDKERITIREETERAIERKDIALVRPYIDINMYKTENNDEQGSREE